MENCLHVAGPLWHLTYFHGISSTSEHVSLCRTSDMNQTVAFSWRRGWFCCVFIHLFVYLLEQQNDSLIALLSFYCTMYLQRWHHISASAICCLWRFVFRFNIQVGLNRLLLAALVAYPVVLHSALLHRGYSQRIGGRGLYPRDYFRKFF